MNAPRHPDPPVMPRPKPNADAYGKAFAAAGIGGLALLALIFAISRLPSSSGLALYATSRLLVPMAVTALFVGYTAKASTKRWHWWQYYLTVIPSALLLLVMVLRNGG